MGIGVVVGGIPNVFYFLRLSDNNPYVLAVWLTQFLVYAVGGSYWLFWGGSIAMLEQHPGFLNAKLAPNSLRFKITWLLQYVVGGLLTFVILYYFRFPIEELPIPGK